MIDIPTPRQMLDEIVQRRKHGAVTKHIANCPRCGYSIETEFLSKYLLRRGWMACPNCTYPVALEE